LGAGLVAQGLGAWVTYRGLGTFGLDSLGESSFLTPSGLSLSVTSTIAAVLTGLGTFCIMAAVILVAGVVATLIVEERFPRPPSTASNQQHVDEDEGE
jgi:hypothetical protein